MKSYLSLSAIAVLAVVAAGAQAFNARTMVIRGELVSSTPLIGGWTVELASNGMALSETASVNADGSFEFRAATAGMHELRVVASDGQLVHQEYVSITGASQQLSIRLPERPSANRS